MSATTTRSVGSGFRDLEELEELEELGTSDMQYELDDEIIWQSNVAADSKQSSWAWWP
eukprot:CAMPEP_0180623878 /NCGR_PEP_ID=MMETSP1037_2-20121125/36466_1 /TAXON_ID=632150 /ORGANISM="Azadinium spinosum, Strain 3D9" /LENGTH=57 /DNA_ID=CAMNT_0022644249 /DNA_START=99 /DNA_END=269 /DNA_ORIENTATION=-